MGKIKKKKNELNSRVLTRYYKLLAIELFLSLFTFIIMNNVTKAIRIIEMLTCPVHIVYIFLFTCTACRVIFTCIGINRPQDLNAVYFFFFFINGPVQRLVCNSIHLTHTPKENFDFIFFPFLALLGHYIDFQCKIRYSLGIIIYFNSKYYQKETSW